MEVTNEEAGGIRCCGSDGCGETYNDDSSRYCIGSECMAWLWTGNEYERAKHQLENNCQQLHFPDDAKPPEGEGWELEERRDNNRFYIRANKKRLGQCGLANFDVMVETA